MTGKPVVPVLVPSCNEDENIRALHAAIVEAAEPLGIPFEMVFVNDRSWGRTRETAAGIADARSS